jgi:hypothetical protein
VSALGAILKYHSEKFIVNGAEHVHHLLFLGIVPGENKDSEEKSATRKTLSGIALRVFGL